MDTPNVVPAGQSSQAPSVPPAIGTPSTPESLDSAELRWSDSSTDCSTNGSETSTLVDVSVDVGVAAEIQNPASSVDDDDVDGGL
jgi:hypothetical protein